MTLYIREGLSISPVFVMEAHIAARRFQCKLSAAGHVGDQVEMLLREILSEVGEGGGGGGG